MKHLTEDQLSAMLDEALDPQARSDADGHLEQCPSCRAALAALTAQEQTLATVFSHDPGDAYFERFADRVEQRIRTERAAGKAPAREPRSRETKARGWGVFGWLRPSRLAWVGAAAAIVVGAGIVFMVNREIGDPSLQDPQLRQRVDQVAGSDRAGQSSGSVEDDAAARDRAAVPAEGELEEAPSVGNLLAEDQLKANGERIVQGLALQSRAGAPGRMKEAYRDERGEELPVPSSQEPGFAEPPQNPPKDQTFKKPRAQSLANEAKQETEKASEGPSQASEERGPEARPDAGPDRDGARQAGKTARREVAPDAEGQATQSKLDKQSKAAEPKPKNGRENAKALTSTTGAKPIDADALRDSPTTRTLAGATDSVGKAFARFELNGTSAQRVVAETTQQNASTVQVCGTIKDHAGRPISGARVVLANRGRSTVSDRAGKYCLDASSGDHSIAVFAVGFQATHRSITVGAETLTEDVTLAAISVLELGRKVRGDYEAWPERAKALARRAQGRSVLAARARSATLYDQAAEDWQLALQATRGGAPELQARFALAEARFRAWEITPTPQRRESARAALETYRVKAPKGADRDVALQWLERVKP